MGEFVSTFFVNAYLKKRPKAPRDYRMDGQVAIVTGGNRGIGKVISRDLAARGAKVIIACRDEGKAQETVQEIIQETPSAVVKVCKIDLTSFASVREFANQMLNDESRIDVLVNNAGLSWQERVVTEDKNEMMLQVNCLSPFLLTCLLAERMSSSPDARVVNVSSIAHHMTIEKINFDDLNYSKGKFAYFEVYGHSKLALMLLTRALSVKLAGKVKVYAADPGVSMTDFFNNMSTFHRLMTSATRVCTRSVQDAGESIVSAVVDQSGLYKPGEQYYMADCQFKDPSPFARQDDAAEKMWSIFIEKTGVTNIQ